MKGKLLLLSLAVLGASLGLGADYDSRIAGEVVGLGPVIADAREAVGLSRDQALADRIGHLRDRSAEGLRCIRLGQQDVARDLQVLVDGLTGDQQVHDLGRSLEDPIDPEVSQDLLSRDGSLTAGRLLEDALNDFLYIDRGNIIRSNDCTLCGKRLGQHPPTSPAGTCGSRRRRPCGSR